MSYNLTLPCGCEVYVSCDPATRIAHTRVIERRAAACPHRQHDVGQRVYLWEILPGRAAALASDGCDVPSSRRPVF